MIICLVKLELMEEEFFCLFVYVLNEEEERKELWRDLSDYYNVSISGNKLWMIFGDFNETLDMTEYLNFDSLFMVILGKRSF